MVQSLLAKYMSDEYLNGDGKSRTIQYWADKGNVSKEQHESAIKEIVGLSESPSFVCRGEAKAFFLYALDYLLDLRDAPEDPEVVWGRIEAKARVYIERFPWCLEDPQDDGSPSLLKPAGLSISKEPKKVSDKDKALAWWQDNLEELQPLRPSEIQNRMSTELGIHRNSCRGLYYVCKKQYPLEG